MVQALKAAAALAVVAALAGVSPVGQPAPGASARDVAFVNGRVFDGNGFIEKPIFVTRDGYFSAATPAGAETVDLAGGYVVPPFGEGHNHNLDNDAVVDGYLRTGIFYVSNPNTHPGSRASLPARLYSPTGVDARLAGGGLTATGGHPIFVVQRNIDRRIWTEADGEGAFYHAIDSADDLIRKWPKFLDSRPDFVKIYLLYSEEFERRRADPAFTGWKGLDPALVPRIVEKAKASGLRVSAHVETAADFRAAVRGGVNEIAHLPGFRPPSGTPPYYPDPDNLDAYRLRADDAARAARAGVIVTTTVSDQLKRFAGDVPGLTTAQRDAVRAVVRDNLLALKRAGVAIALGSDNYSVSSVAEVREIAKLGIFAPVELLRMWSVVTPGMIFPNRKIARLEPGFEASFLVLSGDPTADANNLLSIVRRLKQGVELNPPARTP